MLFLTIFKIHIHNTQTSVLTLGIKTKQIMMVVVNMIPAAWIPNSSSGCDWRKNDIGPAIVNTTTIV